MGRGESTGGRKRDREEGVGRVRGDADGDAVGQQGVQRVLNRQGVGRRGGGGVNHGASVGEDRGGAAVEGQGELGRNACARPGQVDGLLDALRTVQGQLEYAAAVSAGNQGVRGLVQHQGIHLDVGHADAEALPVAADLRGVEGGASDQLIDADIGAEIEVVRGRVDRQRPGRRVG